MYLMEAYALHSTSGSIYTVEKESEKVTCIGVIADRVFATGSLDHVKLSWRKLTGNNTASDLRLLNIDPSSIVVPGLADSHGHVLEWGFKMQLQLDGAASVHEVIDRVRDFIISHPDVESDKTRWITGMGWDQTRWEETGCQFPTSKHLDSDPLLHGRPIVLTRVDGHATWLSPRALALTEERLGGRLPAEVDGGEIVRDDRGIPTGIMVDNAMALVPIPPWTHTQRQEYFDRAMTDALRHGLTSIHDAMSSPEAIEFFKQKAEEGALPVRLYLMGYSPGTSYWGTTIPRLQDYGKDGRLTVRSVKLFTDGALGSWGAALLEPYSDKSSTSGILTTPPDVLEALVKQFWVDGLQVNIHCIGDRANKVALDIFEPLIASDPARDARPRIEHAQIMTLEDLKRTGKLGVIPSVQPTHATSDMGYAELRLGPDRIKGAYAYKTLLKSSQNNILPLGSDFPIEDINPLLGFYAAVSRLTPAGDSPHGTSGWFPEQRLTRAEALKGMTLDAAYASFAEAERGSLAPGKKADFVVLDTDIMTVPFAQILSAKVTATVIDGKVAYGEL